MRLNLDVLSGEPLNVILLDCLMYEDDTLFAKALAALDQDFGGCCWGRRLTTLQLTRTPPPPLPPRSAPQAARRNGRSDAGAPSLGPRV